MDPNVKRTLFEVLQRLAQEAKLTTTGLTPILTFPLKGEGLFLSPLEGES